MSTSAFGVEHTIISKRTVYHGTSWRNANKIAREGIKPSEQGAWGPGTYTSPYKHVAETYSNWRGAQGQKFKGRPFGRRNRVLEFNDDGARQLKEVDTVYGKAPIPKDINLYDGSLGKPTASYKLPLTREQKVARTSAGIGAAGLGTAGVSQAAQSKKRK